MKRAVDRAYDQFEATQESQRSHKKTNSKTTDAETRKDPVLMVQKMTECGTHPRIIIEALLDCIADLRSSGGVGSGVTTVIENSNPSSSSSMLDGVGPDDLAFSSPWMHFEGLGMDESVPIYLRTFNRIQNFTLSKADTERVINDIWIAREAEAYEGTLVSISSRTNFADFFYSYVQNRFKRQDRVIEFCYNFVDALKKYYRDIDCRLFSLVLNNKISEEVRNDQIMTLANFQEQLRGEEVTFLYH